jgi:cytochrome P450
MSRYESVDFFTDETLLEDPYPYYEYLRGQSTVQPTGHHGVVAVTGYDEAAQIYRDNKSFSASNVVAGPFLSLPVPIEGDDVAGILERYRDQIPQNDHIATMDPPMHTQERGLLMGLLTPKRLKDNEAFIRQLVDVQLDEIIDAGHCEFVSAYAQPFSVLVIADLLGVPQADHQRFRDGFGMSAANSPLALPSDEAPVAEAEPAEPAERNTLSWLYDWFAGYIEERRQAPKDDVLTQLAEAKYPDGSTPEVMILAHQAAILFASGGETTARLLSAALIYLAEYPQLQDQLRDHPELVPNFIEECLRLESPIKTDFRLTKQPVTVAGVELAPGTPMALLLGAANRDPRRFDKPDELRVDRANSREHLAFGRGIHFCPGAPLARAEGRLSIERILARTRDIRLSEKHHGSASDRHFEYEPTWLLRAVHELHIEFTPVAD